jgi:integrase/recombinase XerC
MIEAFLKYLEFEKRVSPHTVLSYKNDLYQLQQFCAQTFEESNPAKYNHGMIRSWIVSLAETESANSSINRKIACLRSFYKYLVKQELLTADPMLKVRALKKKKALPSFVNEADITSLLDNVKFEETFEDRRNQLILELFYGTGIRLSELLNLKDADVDLRTLTIKVLGKRNKERIIPFPGSIARLIKDYRAIRNKDFDRNPQGLFFVNNNGGKCYSMLIQRIVKSYLKLVPGLEKRSPHVLRHTFATHLLNKGAEINAVKDLLGHSSLAATQVYTHNSIEKIKKAFDQAHPKA